jgi:hypothetical protein
VWHARVVNTDRLAQLGAVEVPVAALGGGGSPLVDLLRARHVDMRPEFTASGAPSSGWRPLPTPHNQNHLMLVGAPTESGKWFLGQLLNRDGHWDFTLFGPVERHPSQEERRAGLQLRWPPAAAHVPVSQAFIDVHNVSSERWVPTPLDTFHTVGSLVRTGATGDLPVAYSYAFVAGQPLAFPLDPGEYARVHVRLSSNDVRGAGVGVHALYAAVPALGLTSDRPLTVTITEEDVHKAASDRRPAL